MPNIPIRFNDIGLEAAPGEKTQRGLLELQNARLDRGGTLEPRLGATNVLLSTAPSVFLSLDELNALWYRDDELLLETKTQLYSRLECVGTDALVGFAANWSLAGPWTRSRLSAPITYDFGLTTPDILEETAACAIAPPVDPDGQCIIQLLEFNAGGVSAVIYSDHPELLEEIDASGSDPHVNRLQPTIAQLTYAVAGGDLEYQWWQAGDGFSFTTLPLTLLADRVYDASTFEFTPPAQAARYGGVWAAKIAAAGVALHAIDSTSVVYSGLVSPGWTTVDAVAVYGLHDLAGSVPYALLAMVGNLGGTLRVFAGLYDLTNIVAPIWTSTWDTAITTGGGGLDSIAPAITCCARVADYLTKGLVAIEFKVNSGERRVESYEVVSGNRSLVRTYRRCALYGAGNEIQTPTSDLVIAIAAIDESGQDLVRRSGYFLVAPETGQILGRATYAASENRFQRPTRNQVSDTSWDGTTLVMGVRRFQGNGYSQQSLLWDFAQRPNRPAVATGVAVSAHGGYPRAYDGAHTYEHDWHEVVQINSAVANGGGGSITAGSVGVAVTYESTDNQGLLARSSPEFAIVTTTVANDSINLTVRPIVLTERPSVRLVVWRTKVNGGTYFRAFERSAFDATDSILVTLTNPDATLTGAEILDQVAGGVLPAFQAPATDWVAYLDRRFWTRDPGRPGLTRYTIQSSEGIAPHWPTAFVTETPDSQTIVAGAEQDGRVILFGGPAAASAYLLGSGGPTDSGQGGYATPRITPIEIGAIGQSGVVRTPIGIVFVSTEGPRLYTRADTTVNLGEVLERWWEIEGVQLETVEYVAPEGTIRFGSLAGRVPRYHPETNRWSEDTGRLSLDATKSLSGIYAVLTAAGKVLIEDTDQRPDGSAVEVFRLRTRYIHLPTNDGLVHGSFTVPVIAMWGNYLGEHTLIAETYYDYQTTPTNYQILDSELSDPSRPYINVVDGNAALAWAVSIAYADEGEDAPTFRIAGIDVNYTTVGSTEPREFPERFKMDRV